MLLLTIYDNAVLLLTFEHTPFLYYSKHAKECTFPNSISTSRYDMDLEVLAGMPLV